MKSFFLLLFIFLAPLRFCFGNVSITSPSLSITASGCLFPSSYNALGNIVIDENANGDFDFPAASTNYTIVLSALANFEFQPATGTITNTGAGDITAISMVVTATTITITYQSSDGNRTNEDDIITISGIQMRAITAVSSGNVTRTSGTGTIAGLVNGNSVASVSSACPMIITASTVTQSSVASISNCGVNAQIVRLEITTTGTATPLTLTQVQTNFSGTALATNISLAKIYYTGTSATFSTSALFGSATPSAATYNINGSQVLSTGTNYFWLTYDLNNTATLGNTVDGIITQFTASAVNYNSGTSPNISVTNPAGSRSIILCTGPGGVTTGLSHWVKSDVGVIGNPVTNWQDNSIMQILGDMVSLSGSASPTVQTGIINYQNYIRFDGSDDGMNSTNAVTAVTSGLFGDSDNSIFMVKNNHQPGVDLKWETASAGNYRIGAEIGTNIQRFDFVNDASGKNDISTTNILGINRILSALGQATSSTIYFNGIPDATKTYGTSLSLGGAGGTVKNLFLGCNDNSTFPIFSNVDIAEEIIFNNRLNATDQLRVESYLAVKYRITLGNATTPSNYIASSTTITWNALSAYQNNIIGLGRDDNASLYTKQSREQDDSVRIYMGTLQTTNSANTSTFSSNLSFILQGSNTGKLCSTTASFSEMPAACTLYSRLEREWRVKRTNMAQNYNMDIKLATCAAPGSVNVADLRFLVDDDGNFGNGGTTCYFNGDGTGIVISYSNPVITVSNISTTHIANNSTRFVTIGSVNELTPLPVELLYFEASLNNSRTVDLTWSTSSEINNDHFIVERSPDGFSWNEIGMIEGAGNSNILLEYATIDNFPLDGNNYYRLKQVDFDGTANYSAIRVINLSSPESLTVYPNPASGYFILEGKDLDAGYIHLINAMGEDISMSVLNSGKDKIEYTTEGISNGIYTLEIQMGSETTYKKLVIFNQ